MPVRRSGELEDVASTILYLASQEASFVSGQILYVGSSQGTYKRVPLLLAQAAKRGSP